MYLATKTIALIQLPVYLMGGLICLIALQFIFGRVHFLRNLVEIIVDRSVVFLYLYIPLSLAGVIGVILRNF